MNSNAGIALIAALSLAGCSSETPDGGGHPLADCDQDNGVCKVAVDVATDCTITPEPPSLPVKGRHVNIHWDLRSVPAGAKFPATGAIVFKDDNDQQFDTPNTNGNGQKVTVNDKNVYNPPTPGVDHKYNYKIVVNIPDHAPCGLDPTIVNKG